MEPIRIKQATQADVQLISSLATKIWNAHYPAIISHEQIEYMLELMYSEKALKDQLDKGHYFYLAYQNESPVGYISYSRQREGAYFLHKFYVDTQEHRKGIGHELFRHLLSIIGEGHEVRLTVNRKNFKAINFYFKEGFLIEEVADFDIGNNYVMNDFIMVRTT